jgi:glycosyltransferase involved in cell wall biosynthesis
MNVSYVGDFLNHGGLLYTSGTPVTILLSLCAEVDSVDVFCPNSNKVTEDFIPPKKVKINPSYRREDPLSIMKLLKINWKSYDVVIFNMLPTGFGIGTISNSIALLIPILVAKLKKYPNIKIIYHNSVYTNDIRKLGYSSIFDKFRSLILSIVERYLFKSITTFVLLKLYKRRIDTAIKKNSVHVLDSQYLEAITTLYLNNVIELDTIDQKNHEIPLILMHGSWGPQKNLELGLSALRALKNRGEAFNLVISGGISEHFPEYKKKFLKILDSYSDIIDKYLGRISEKEIMGLFLDASLLILPYNTPGGHSGVLEQAIFFKVPTIAIDFPEYEEQANGISSVKFVTTNNFYSMIANCLKFSEERQEISIRDNVAKALTNVKQLLVTVTDW